MADAKWSAKAVLSGPPLASDQLLIIDDPGATPLSRKVTLTNLLQGGMGQNVLHHGAFGDSEYSTGSGHDDTAAFQAAHDAAVAAGGSGLVTIPGNHTYQITGTLYTQQGVMWKGIGGRDSVGFGNPPFLVWNGANNGCMFEAVGAGGYIIGCQFHDLCIRSGQNITNKLGTGVRFPSDARCDSGTVFRNFWVQSIDGTPGHGIEVNGGATNFYWDGGRFDGIPVGYAIYANCANGFIASITGNTNYVGGGTVNGKGFMCLDAGSGGESFVQISGLHTEINQPLLELYASGTNPSDKRGIIHCITTGDAGSTQHQINVNGWYNAQSGGIASYSTFLITSASGTDLQAGSGVKITGANGNLLHMFVSADNAVNGEVRLVGGKVPAEYRFHHKSARQGFFQWGYGPDSNGDSIGGGIYQRPGTFEVGGMTLLPRTALAGPYQAGGGLEFVTDHNGSLTVGTTYASGGSGKALVFYNGTAWKIAAI